jgi:RNA polymerase sigma-70 factor (ECF subfamily)
MQERSVDRALIDRLKGGDVSAVGDLERIYRTKIYQLAFRYMKNHEDAEEVTQDVLLRVHQKIGAFRGDAALSSWIYRITFNTAMSRLRSVKYRRPFEIPQADLLSARDDGRPAPAGEVADWSSMADDEVHRAELRRRLVVALKDLPTIYRVPVVLRDVQGLSTEEASALLQLKPQTLKSRLHRGRLILRQSLAEFSDGLALHRPAA